MTPRSNLAGLEHVLLTLYEKLSLIISFLGVLSLVLIFVQTKQTTTNMKASMYATMTTQTLEMDKTFLQL